MLVAKILNSNNNENENNNNSTCHEGGIERLAGWPTHTPSATSYTAGLVVLSLALFRQLAPPPVLPHCSAERLAS